MNTDPNTQQQPPDEREQIEVQTNWFKLRIEDITWQTIVVIAMILAAAVQIVSIIFR